MERDFKTVAEANRNEYLRVLLKNYRDKMQSDMDRLRHWRERRGEIMFAGHMMEKEGRVIRENLKKSWALYREVSGFIEFSDKN